jgi:hypothetical protein
LAYGLGLRDTRAPRDMSRANRTDSPTGREIPGPFHIEVYGEGPYRGDARRSPHPHKWL